MSNKIYPDPDEEWGKYAMKVDKSDVEYYTVKSLDEKTIHRVDTYEEALIWVENFLSEEYEKPLVNRHRFFRRNQNIIITGDRTKFKILKVRELDVFKEYQVK